MTLAEELVKNRAFLSFSVVRIILEIPPITDVSKSCCLSEKQRFLNIKIYFLKICCFILFKNIDIVKIYFCLKLKHFHQFPTLSVADVV